MKLQAAPMSSSYDYAEIRQRLSDVGVNDETSASLIEKLKSGVTWDSFKPNALPVDTKTVSSNGESTTTYTYADGSVLVSQVPDFQYFENNSNKARLITGCVYSQSGNTRYWKNCSAIVNRVVIQMGFNFNYQNFNHANPKITSYGPYHHYIVGGSLSNFRFNRISASQVRLSADFDLAFQGFPAGWTAWMQANVTGDNAWTSNN